MIVDRAVDAPRDAAEPPKVTDNGARDEGKDDRFCALGEAPGREDKVVEHVAPHEDGKVERRKLVRVRRCRKDTEVRCRGQGEGEVT